MPYRAVPAMEPREAAAWRESYPFQEEAESYTQKTSGTALGPGTLEHSRLELVAAWTWDILLTILPALFVGEFSRCLRLDVTPYTDSESNAALAIAAVRLDGQSVSDHGEQVVDLTRLSPTVYPILFAALASRFFKNLSRWRLEQRNGIALDTLEQIFGSQSLAGAFDRLLFVRTKVLIGIAILCIWAMSPIGGQSAVRLLSKGESPEVVVGSVYYANPLWQPGGHRWSWVDDEIVANAFYTASLISTLAQRRSLMDLWGFPRIPQWPRDLGDDVLDRQLGSRDWEALTDGDEYYCSLLGVPLQGFNLVPTNQTAEYEFMVQSVYYDINCTTASNNIGRDEIHRLGATLDPKINLTKLHDTLDGNVGTEGGPSFVSDILPANVTEVFPENTAEPHSLDSSPPAEMFYMTQDFNGQVSRPNPGYNFSLYRCDMLPIVTETYLICNTSAASTDCRATRQKRITSQFDAGVEHLLTGRKSPDPGLAERQITGDEDYRETERYQLLQSWSLAEGSLYPGVFSTTDKYLSGQTNPVTQTGVIDWSVVSLEDISRRLTTVFNTYWWASLKPSVRAEMTLQSQPTTEGTTIGFMTMNETDARVETHQEVYILSHFWAATLVVITACLQILALLGLVLRFLIRGPDVLGFASSFTRDNAHINMATGGSSLDGPERARALRGLRMHLADVRPLDNVGYIAVRAVPTGEQEEEMKIRGTQWRPLKAKRQYE